MLFLVFCSAWAGPQESAPVSGKPANLSVKGSAESPDEPLSQDLGEAGLKLRLRRLQTTARLLQTVAHPDDEDGGMLTLESRGKGVSTTLLTLNRGEGGQNKVGSNLFDVLGVLRTLELLAADRYYGVDQRFTRVADFGFSKTPEETFQKWRGHDTALADMVRVIRTIRPDVIAARFSGTDRDGHGHHQASSLLSREAFRAAADPKLFPEQLRAGLLPWQVKKLYIGNVCGFGASSCPEENYTVRLNTGEVDVALGKSYAEFAMDGLRHQLSQGAGGWSVEPGPRYTYYKLVDSVLAKGVHAGHENDFFEGIDTLLPGLAKRLGDDAAKLPHFRSDLQHIQDEIETATSLSADKMSRAAGPLLSALSRFGKLIDTVEKSQLDSRQKLDLLNVLRDKYEQCEEAVNLAMGTTLEANVAPATGPVSTVPPEPEALTIVSAGQRLTVLVKFHNGSKYPLKIERLKLESPQDWVAGTYKGDNGGFVKASEDFYANLRLKVPVDAPATRPYWHRDDPEKESVNKIDDENYATLPFSPLPLKVRVAYRITGRADLAIAGLQVKGTDGPRAGISAEIRVPYVDKNGRQQRTELAVAPAFSVMLEPGTQIIPTNETSSRIVTVGARSNTSEASKGTLRLNVPRGWKVEPSDLTVEFHKRGEKQDFQFSILPEHPVEGKGEVRAVLTVGGRRFTEGYTLVTRDDLGAAYYYQPAEQRVSMVDVNVPSGLRVAYVPGAGDDIPVALKQAGIDVSTVSADKVGTEDLSKYGSVVLGIRAYDTQPALIASNAKLMKYVSDGGTLLVQYNSGVSEFNRETLTPFAAELSRQRVTVEEAPVEILQPKDGVFNYPNKIVAKDFDGWVQERGLYFMDKWDEHFVPLLACHDPDQPEQKGGLLRARYGKGVYIYTGYAFFRQIPAGVPGAVRLFVNLLSSGHEGLSTAQAAVAPD